jgi:hypothetical protein
METLCSTKLLFMIGSSFLGYADVSSGMRDCEDNSVKCVALFVWEVDQIAA